MLTTVAALVIVLGLMISLSRHVRRASAVELTKDLLRRLDSLMAQYEAQNHRLPNIAPFATTLGEIPSTDANERELSKAAMENNRQTLAALRGEMGSISEAFSGLSEWIYDETVLKDAWGVPIVYMPSMHPSIGMAPQNRRFFFSAGPDHKFLTQEDNLYSYEEPPPRQAVTK